MRKHQPSILLWILNYTVVAHWRHLAILLPGESKAEGDSAKGAEVYKSYCATCHGDTGKGDGVAAAALDPKPRDLSNAEYVSGLTDEHIKKVIAEGGTAVGMSR